MEFGGQKKQELCKATFAAPPITEPWLDLGEKSGVSGII